MIDREYLKLNTSIQTGSNAETLIYNDEGDIQATIELRLPENLYGSNSGPRKIDSVEMQTSKMRLSMANTPIAQIPLDTKELTESLIPSLCKLDVFPFCLLDNDQIKPDPTHPDEVSAFPYYKQHSVTFEISLFFENTSTSTEYETTTFKMNTEGYEISPNWTFYNILNKAGIFDQIKPFDHVMSLCAQSNHEPFMIEGDSLFIKNIGTLEQMLQDALENAITYASTEINDYYKVNLIEISLAEGEPSLDPPIVDFTNTVDIAGRTFVLWSCVQLEGEGYTKLQNHLKFACKPRVKLSEQSLTISYDSAAFDTVIPICWNTPYVDTFDHPEQLMLNRSRRSVWEMPPPKRVYKYDIITERANKPFSYTYNFGLLNPLNCAAMNIIGNQQMKDTFSFLPWIQVDTPKIEAFDPSLNPFETGYKGKYKYETVYEYEVYEYDISQFANDSNGQLILPLLKTEMLNDDFKHAYPTLNGMHKVRIVGQGGGDSLHKPIMYAFEVPIGVDPDDTKQRTGQNIAFGGSFTSTADTSKTNSILPPNIYSGSDNTPSRIVYEQYSVSTSYSNMLLGNDQLGTTSLSLDQADEPIIQIEGSIDDWVAQSQYDGVEDILFYDTPNKQTESTTSLKYGVCPNLNSETWMTTNPVSWVRRWLPPVQPDMVSMGAPWDGKDYYYYFYNTPTTQADDGYGYCYGMGTQTTGEPIAIYRYVGSSDKIRIKKLIGYKKTITYTEPEYNVTLDLTTTTTTDEMAMWGVVKATEDPETQTTTYNYIDRFTPITVKGLNYGDYLWAVASYPSIEWEELTSLLIARYDFDADDEIPSNSMVFYYYAESTDPDLVTDPSVIQQQFIFIFNEDVQRSSTSIGTGNVPLEILQVQSSTTTTSEQSPPAISRNDDDYPVTDKKELLLTSTSYTQGAFAPVQSSDPTGTPIAFANNVVSRNTLTPQTEYEWGKFLGGSDELWSDLDETTMDGRTFWDPRWCPNVQPENTTTGTYEDDGTTYYTYACYWIINKNMLIPNYETSELARVNTIITKTTDELLYTSTIANVQDYTPPDPPAYDPEHDVRAMVLPNFPLSDEGRFYILDGTTADVEIGAQEVIQTNTETGYYESEGEHYRFKITEDESVQNHDILQEMQYTINGEIEMPIPPAVPSDADLAVPIRYRKSADAIQLDSPADYLESHFPDRTFDYTQFDLYVETNGGIRGNSGWGCMVFDCLVGESVIHHDDPNEPDDYEYTLLKSKMRVKQMSMARRTPYELPIVETLRGWDETSDWEPSSHTVTYSNDTSLQPGSTTVVGEPVVRINQGFIEEDENQRDKFGVLRSLLIYNWTYDPVVSPDSSIHYFWTPHPYLEENIFGDRELGEQFFTNWDSDPVWPYFPMQIMDRAFKISVGRRDGLTDQQIIDKYFNGHTDTFNNVSKWWVDKYIYGYADPSDPYYEAGFNRCLKTLFFVYMPEEADFGPLAGETTYTTEEVNKKVWRTVYEYVTDTTKTVTTIEEAGMPEYAANVRLSFTWNNLPMVVMSPIASIVLTLSGVQLTQEIQPINIAQQAGSSLTSTIPVIENFYSMAQTLRDLHDELVVAKDQFGDTALYKLPIRSGQERSLTLSAKYITKDGTLHQIYIPKNGVFSVQLTFGVSYYFSS